MWVKCLDLSPTVKSSGLPRPRLGRCLDREPPLLRGTQSLSASPGRRNVARVDVGLTGFRSEKEARPEKNTRGTGRTESWGTGGP